jgi:hypothetical protein
MMIAGLYVIAIASYYYIATGLGAGPRDCLMVLLTRITRRPIGVVRGVIEFSVALIGWLMGGMAGMGTIISVFAIGFCIQTTFAFFRFNPVTVKQETIQETLDGLRTAFTAGINDR